MGSVKENLIAARALIDTPEKWAKGPHPDGGRMCALRAVERACGLTYADGWRCPEGDALQSALEESGLGRVVGEYNDDRRTTHADIMALFSRAIAAQEKGEGE